MMRRAAEGVRQIDINLMTWLALSFSCSFGIVLRFFRLGSMAVFGDEIHSLRLALEYSLSWWNPEFVLSGGYMSFASYLNLLVSTVGLDEWTMRLPSVLAGSLALLVVARVSYHRLPPLEAIVVTTMTAASPFLVYLSRIARPYSIVLLLCGVALWQTLGWRDDGRRRSILVASVAGALAVCVHGTALPSVLCLGTYAIVVTARDPRLRARTSMLIQAGVVFVTILLVLLGPRLTTAVADIGHILTFGAAQWTDFSGALVFPLGTPGMLGISIVVITGSLGIVRGALACPLETGAAVSALALQIVFLLIIQPSNLVSFTVARYSAHLFPILFVLMASGICWPLAWVPNTRARAVIVLAVSLLMVSQVWAGFSWRHYALAHDQSLNVQPMLYFLPALDPEHVEIAGVSTFYTKVLPTLPPGALIEAPIVLTYPLVDLYQRLHGREVLGAGLLPNSDDTDEGPGKFGITAVRPADEAALVTPRDQLLFRKRPGVDFRQAVFIEDLRDSQPARARFLVVHKQLLNEIPLVNEWLERQPEVRDQIAKLSWLAHPIGLLTFYGPEIPGLPDDHPLSRHLVFEDEWLAVYDLSADDGSVQVRGAES